MLQINAAPNGVPSVHMSTALLVVWFSRKSRAGLAIASVYLLLIVVATLASGQHYAVDLLAAVPYASGIVWLVKGKGLGRRPSTKRWQFRRHLPTEDGRKVLATPVPGS